MIQHDYTFGFLKRHQEPSCLQWNTKYGIGLPTSPLKNDISRGIGMWSLRVSNTLSEGEGLKLICRKLMPEVKKVKMSQKKYMFFLCKRDQKEKVVLANLNQCITYSSKYRQERTNRPMALFFPFLTWKSQSSVPFDLFLFKFLFLSLPLCFLYPVNIWVFPSIIMCLWLLFLVKYANWIVSFYLTVQSFFIFWARDYLKVFLSL